MKFAFVSSSPNDSIETHEGKVANASFPPLGILYLASVLEQEGIEVSVLDQPAMGYSVSETVKWIENKDPDVVGILCPGKFGAYCGSSQP